MPMLAIARLKILRATPAAVLLLAAPLALAEEAAPAAPTAPAATSSPPAASPAPAPRAYPPPPPRYPTQTPPPNYPGYPANAAPGPSYQQYPYNPYQRYPYSPSPYPAPTPRGVYRPFSLTIAGGPGALLGPDEHDFALSYSIFRLGIGLVPNFSFVFSLEGAGTTTTNPFTHEDSWLSQHAWLFGAQFHLLQRFYVRGGFGVAFLSEETSSFYVDSTKGLAVTAAVGYEVLQTPHVALALELDGTGAKYSNEWWQMGGLHLALSFF
jgi:hypothetical protein